MPASTLHPLRAHDDLEEFRRLVRQRKPGPHFYVVLLGLKLFDTGELLKAVERGFAFQALERFRYNVRMSWEDLAEVIQIPPRTLSRRKTEGRLHPDESDRLLRASRVFAAALELFEGDVEAARRWLSEPQTALGGAPPLAVVKTEVGAREVEKLIGRLEHGVVS